MRLIDISIMIRCVRMFVDDDEDDVVVAAGARAWWRDGRHRRAAAEAFQVSVTTMQ
jgi:hypothetical protein